MGATWLHVVGNRRFAGGRHGQRAGEQLAGEPVVTGGDCWPRGGYNVYSLREKGHIVITHPRQEGE
jgi:hypothetical protein